jgi:isopenicillin N synthase-like dioxygenase
MTGIPVLDLSDALAAGGARDAEVARQLRAAAMSSGFFYVRHHGIAAELVRAQFDMARHLMAAPAETRKALSLRNSPTLRGYEGIGEQTLDALARPDVKESFCCGAAYPDDHPYVRAGYQSYGHNQWPPQLPDAPKQCETYIQAMRTLAQRLMQLMALSLDLHESYFDHTIANPMLTLRINRYPAHPVDADDRTFGAGAHTDWGALTILAQETYGGLEVSMPDGSWVAAPPMPGAFVVNLGDMIPRWTNGLYHSNPHRVRNTQSGGAPRYSMAFFFEPDYLARIEAVPGTLAPGETPRFAACTAGEHLREMYRITYQLKDKETARAATAAEGLE